MCVRLFFVVHGPIYGPFNGLYCKRFFLNLYCWFSHDFTKIQTTKLSILPTSYFHDVLEQPKIKLISMQIFASKGFLVLW